MFRLRLKYNLMVLWRTYSRWQADDGPMMSAAVSYYLGLSIFPMLITLISGVGLFFRYTLAGQDAEQHVLHLLAEQASPALEEQVRSVLTGVRDQSQVGGPLGILGLLVAAIAGFTQFERSLDRIWNIPPSFDKGILAGLRHTLIERGVAFLMLLGSGLIVVAVFIANVMLSGLEDFLRNRVGIPSLPGPQLRVFSSLAINAILFTLVFRLLTPRPVLWKDALRAGLLTASGWEVGRVVLGAVVIGTKYTDAYGLIGSFLAVMLWCYYVMTIIFLGAEYLKETTLARPEESLSRTTEVAPPKAPTMPERM